MVDVQDVLEDDDQKTQSGQVYNDTGSDNDVVAGAESILAGADVVAGAENILKQENEAAKNGQGGSGSTDGDNPDKKGGAVSGDKIAAAEGVGAAAGVADQVGNGFSAASPIGRAQALKNFFVGSTKRKRATASTAIVGMVVSGGFLGLTFVSGPFQFIHAAQLLERFHFSNIDDSSNDRFSKLISYSYHQAKGEEYKSNLGFIGNKLAGHFDNILSEQGLESNYTRYFGEKVGYVIDTDNEAWQQDGKAMTQEEMQSKVDADFGSSAVVSSFTDSEGAERYLIEQPSNYFSAAKLYFGILKDAGESNITAAMGTRLVATRDGLSLHPLRILDNKLYTNLDQKIAEWKAQKAENIDDGVETPVGGTQETPEKPDGAPTTTPATVENADEVAKGSDGILTEAQQAQQGLEEANPGPLTNLAESIHLKVALGGAAAVGAVCLMHGLAKDADKLKEAEVALPLARMGMRVISEGNQIMADSSDIDINELGLDSQQFYDPSTSASDPSAGTSWTDANSIEAELDEPLTSSGVPSSTLQTIGSGTPFSFLLTGAFGSALSDVCGTVGTVATTIVSFLGGPISAIGGLIGSAIFAKTAGPAIFNDAAKWLAGDAVDTLAEGAGFGNDIDFGARIAADDQAVSAGGTGMTSSQELAFTSNAQQTAQAQFDSQSLAYKIFSPDSSESIVGTLLNHQSPVLATNLQRATFAIMDIGHTIASLPSMLFSGVVKAAGQVPFNYGFQAVGFSVADLTNASIQNPYQNADNVADLLSNQQTGPGYIKLAQQCFGDTLDQVTVTDPSSGQQEQVWDVNYGTSAVDTFSSTYPTSSCDNESDPNWLAIRIFILDMQNMKAADCYYGDAQSCADLGFSSYLNTPTN